MRFELHCHSTCSDGTEEASRVAARASERGVAVFALTDHDTCAATGLPVEGARSIRGVEMSCDDAGRTVHVLAYDKGGDWASLDARLESVRVGRKNRLVVMAARLARRGIKLDITGLVDEADRRSVGRPDLARAFETRNPLGRAGEHRELADLVAFLLAPGSAYINGEVVTIDGGEWLRGAGQFSFLMDTLGEEDWAALRPKKG